MVRELERRKQDRYIYERKNERGGGDTQERERDRDRQTDRQADRGWIIIIVWEQQF